MTGDQCSDRFNALTLQRFSLLAALSLLLAACANHHFRVAAEGPPGNAPRYVVLEKEKQIATLHFPAGTYTFYAVDDAGYYYRAPRKVLQHSGGASWPRDGGIFVSKRDMTRLRGYIYLAGSLTHVGNLSRVPHQFHN